MSKNNGKRATGGSRMGFYRIAALILAALMILGTVTMVLYYVIAV